MRFVRSLRPDGAISVTFADGLPGMAVSPGQICAAYVGQRCLGGGEIAEREWTWDEGVVLETAEDATQRTSKRAIRRAEQEQRKQQQAAQN
jgi:hypothetical protein